MKRIVNALRRWNEAGICCSVLLAATAMALPAQTFTTLYRFDYGSAPTAGLVQATDRNFYGTTWFGGANEKGTVFKMTPNGTLTTLYSFCSQSNCTDGAQPFAALVQVANGDFYGTTESGGTPAGNGTVFKITAEGTLRTVHSFCAQSGCTDGSHLYAALVQTANRDLYGTIDANSGFGTVFKISPGGTLTTLHTFCYPYHRPSCTGGAAPFGALVLATDGDLYGTTNSGGSHLGGNYGGTIFKMTPSGKLTTLYNFCAQSGCTDGSDPYAGLVQATDGNFYGTTLSGGANTTPSGTGVRTVFEITPSGSFTTLYNFCSQNGCTDGSGPFAGLVQGTDGNLYGTTEDGGANEFGTVFRITTSGALTTLYSFCSRGLGGICADGDTPEAGLIQGTDGNFYGTTLLGGANCNCGTVFSLSVGLGPFVETQTKSGKVGEAVTILGNNLTGASSVTFNGTAAAFTVNSTGSAISTTVPVGATTGGVQVTVPGGSTLSSNVPFRVLPLGGRKPGHIVGFLSAVGPRHSRLDLR